MEPMPLMHISMKGSIFDFLLALSPSLSRCLAFVHCKVGLSSITRRLVFISESFLVQSQRGQLYQVKKVISDVNPPLFELVDLQQDPIPGKYYRQQLTKSPPPTAENYFFIESVLKKRKVGEKTEYFVKFLYYPRECMNQFLDD